jgi:hypothetical protein
MYRLLLATALLAWSASPAPAQNFVIPPTAAGAEGSSTISYVTPGTFQCVYAASVLGSMPPGTTLAGIAFRMDGGQPTNELTTYSNFNVYLGPSNFAPGSLSASAATNEGFGTLLVRSGPITFPAGTYPGGAGPNPFGEVIPFTTAYVYNGGDLLLTIAYDNPTNALFWDAVNVPTTEMETRFGTPYNPDTLDSEFAGYGPVIKLSSAAVPEPATLLLLSGGMAAAGVWWWRRRSRERLAGEEAVGEAAR